MSNPNAAVAAREAKPVEKTPSYAWPCLITSVLAGIALVFAWQWLPGITFPVFKNWLAENNALFANPANFELMSNVMGLVPIGALIMALPASYLVRKIGPKAATVAGLALGAVGTAVSAVFVGDNFYAFLVGRFILGVALATTIVAGPTCVSVWFPDATRGRAMAIWSIWAPVGIFVINFIGNNVFEMAGSDMVAFQWIWVAVIVVFAVIFAIVFREPRENERSQVSPERKSFKEVLPFFKSRQLWCLIIMFMIFNYMNYFFSNYLKTWLAMPIDAGGMGWDPGMAGLLGGLICACGVLSPIGGWILDKLPANLKFTTAVVGIAGLTLASATSFVADAPIFAAYIIFFCIGNMLLNGVCRPLVPTFVFKGGATAVALGLSCLTFCQYLGQIPTTYVHALGEAAGMSIHEIAMIGLVPVGVIGIIISLFIKPSKPKVAKSGTAMGNTPAAGEAAAQVVADKAPVAVDDAPAADGKANDEKAERKE